MLELNTKQIAQLLDVTQRQVANYKSGSNPIPVVANYGGNRGTVFDGHEVLKWWLARTVGSSNHDLLDPQQEKAKLDKARRELVTMDKQKRSGELMEREEVLKAVTKVAFEIKSKILSLPTKYSHVLLSKPPQDIKESNALLKSIARELLDEISAGDKCSN